MQPSLLRVLASPLGTFLVTCTKTESDQENMMCLLQTLLYLSVAVACCLTKSYVPDEPHDAPDALAPHDVGGEGSLQAGEESSQQAAGAVHCVQGVVD